MEFIRIVILLLVLISCLFTLPSAYGEPIPTPDKMTDSSSTVTAGTVQANLPITTQGLTALKVNGGEVVFDVSNQAYWLADANFAASSEGQKIQAEMGITTINANGTMDYLTALAWVQALNQVKWNGCIGYLCHTDWQLPVTPLTDITCAVLSGPNGGSFGPLCTGSALGSLYSTGLNLNYPNSVVPGFTNTIGPMHNLQPSLYWAAGTNSGGEITYSFATDHGGANTTKYNFFYILPMVSGAIATPPSCPSGSTEVLPYTIGPAARKALYECGKGYTWSVNATLARKRKFGDTGTTTIPAYGGRELTVPLINSSGAMLFGNGTEPPWIDDMNKSNQGMGFAGSNQWILPTLDDLKRLFQDLQLQPGDTRFLSKASVGPFQHLQPFFYWACERDQSGNSQSPCNGMDAPTPPDQKTPMEWSFNFDIGFQGTDLQTKQFYVMLYYPAPAPIHCSNPIQCCVQAGGYWSNGHCE
jgi:hypothetical protein